MFNILEVSENLNLENFKVNEDSNLKVKWSEGDHTSEFSPKWLRENCYTIKNKKNIFHHTNSGTTHYKII